VNEHEHIQVDLLLIGRYLAGEAQPEEAIAVDKWREQAVENERTFNEYSRLWAGAAEGQSYSLPDRNRKWEQLKTGLEESNRPAKRRLPLSLKIAAGVLLMVGATMPAWFMLRQPPAGNHQVLSAAGGIRTDTLADKSVITLTANSRLTVHNGFATNSRDVSLNGEGYFSVAPLQGTPFVVNVDKLRIEVLGTSFNIRQDTGTVTVTVNSGAVKLTAAGASLIVAAGRAAVYDKRNDQLSFLATADPNVYAYATGAMYFYNAPMSEVKKVLEKTYNIRIVFENSLLANCRINTEFNHQSLQEVLDVIAASLGIKYRSSGNIVYFSGDECR
jgi:ferric-dicitrate binding protein FerR (iron transport regulator)